MFILVVFLLTAISAYLIMKTEKRNDKLDIPKDVLFFYSMDGCMHCDTMQSTITSANLDINIFKINLKSDLTREYSGDSEEYKRLSQEINVDAYPTLIIGKSRHTGTMTQEELKKFLNVSLN